MSVKHVKQYFKDMQSQFSEMCSDIKELEEAVSSHIVDPDVLDSYTGQLETLKTNYMRLVYIMYLLDMPNKKEKVPAYKRRMEKAISNIQNKDTQSGVVQENNRVLVKFKQDIKNIGEE